MKADLLDSSAWIECLDDGLNTKHFAPILRKMPRVIVPTVVVAEVRKVVIRQRSRQEADNVTVALCTGILVPLDESIAIAAADLSTKHKLPLADSIIYATALANNALLWTQDDHFKGLPQVRYFPKIKPASKD